MSDQLLPDFDGPGNQPDEMRPGPKKPRRKPAKKKARAAPVPRPAKRVPKKRRVRKTPMPASVKSESRLFALIDACNKISKILESLLSREERSAVMRSAVTGLS